MKTKDTIRMALGFFTAILLITVGSFGGVISSGCGSESVSAPPVDLPAPITGRITISAPDADGNVHITGTGGAVTGGSMVMAVNEMIAGTQATNILDMFVRPAYAQATYPSVCSEAGRACTMAGDDGSFELLMPASIGDSIVIGVIDPTTGSWTSELLRRSVPSTDDAATTDCSTEGVNGDVVDVAVAPSDSSKKYVLLKQGSETSPNQIVIGSASSTAVIIDISGCHAHSVAMVANSDGTATIAVTSQEDKILWTGRLSGNSIESAQGFSLTDEPMHIAFGDSGTEPIVALKTAGTAATVALAKISLSDGSQTRSMNLTTADSGGVVTITGLTRSTRIDTVAMTNGNHLGLVVTDAGDPTGAYITFFVSDTLRELNTWQAGPTADIRAVDAIGDAAFWTWTSATGSDIYLAIVDPDNNNVSLFQAYNADQTELGTNVDLSTINSLGSIAGFAETDAQNFGLINIAISNKVTVQQSMAPTAIVTTSTGQLYLFAPTGLNNTALVSVTTDYTTISLVAISLDDASDNLYVADSVNDVAISMSSVY